MISQVFEVLLVEDNAADVRLTREALKEWRVPYRLHAVVDGIEALQYLRRQGPFSNAPRPNVILLDWNLPRMDGREVLREIKTDERLRTIPVVVLTTSKAASDIHKAYDLHANCFINKPVNMSQFFEIIAELERFWVRTATLPSYPALA